MTSQVSAPRVQIQSLLAHDIAVRTDSGPLIIPASGPAEPRVVSGRARRETVRVGSRGVTVMTPGPDLGTTALPPERPGVLMVVSARTALANRTRQDLVYPGPSSGQMTQGLRVSDELRRVC